MTAGTDRWETILAGIRQKQSFARQMGGAERVERHRAAGKLDARQRAESLFDDGSFVEIGALTGIQSETGAAPAPADGLIAGFGLVDGRPVLAGIEDFTVLGGSIGDAGAAKRYRLTQLAAQERVPLIFMLEGAGHRLTNSHGVPTPNDLQGLAELSGLTPIVCLVLGASAGHGALAAPLSDFVAMTEAASMFVAGPPLVKGAIGESVTKEELGGSDIHLAASGVAHNLAKDDVAAIAMARRYLSYLPRNAWETPERRVNPDTGPRRLDAILELIHPDPRIPFDMTALLEMLADEGTLFEVQPLYGRAMVTALAQLGGWSVAIVANNPSVGAGAIDSAAARKAAHFMDVADAFHLPVLFLADTPGVMPGTVAERSGILRHAARMFVTQHRLSVPKIHVTLRKAFGFGSSVMAVNPFDGQTLRLAFPAISLGAMPAGSGAQAAKLDEATRDKVAAEQAASAMQLADRMVYDDVIDPRELRNAVLNGLKLAEHRLTGPCAPRQVKGITP